MVFAVQSTLHTRSSYMRSALVSIAATSTAAIGGGFAVFGGYDDAPGGVLIGLVLVLAAMVVGVRNAQPASTRG
jgi:hypothetical protein